MATRTAETSPARGLREQLPGLVVLTVFLAAGLAIWVTVLRPTARVGTAPSRPAPPPAGAAVPPDHPPMALPDEAKKFVASMVEKAKAAPNDVAAWTSLAQVQGRASEIDPSYRAQAVESFKHVLTLAPDNLDAIRGLGNLYYDQGDHSAAATQYERYLASKPDDPSVRTDLATTYLYQRQVDRAITAYQSVLADHPDFMQAHFNLALAYEAKGDRAKAFESLAKAKSLAPDEQTRTQIDRVRTQLEGAASARGPLAAGGAAPDVGRPAPAAASPGGPPAAASAPAGAAAPGSFREAVEAALRAHQILGPKISRIE
jgi:tetratricopeptide (TPR) repeat protein